MRISHAWLSDLLGPLPPPEDVGRILTQQGLEVEGIEHLGAGLEGAVVAEVKELSPVSERLTRVVLGTGDGDAVCVTGAKNLAVSDRVPYAPPGTRLPDGRTLETAEFHGVLSHGMLLSADEIGIGQDPGGILVLPDDAPIGADVSSYLELPEAVYEIGLTPSFAQHCQSAYGIARELAARLGRTVPALEARRLGPPPESAPKVTVEEEEICPLYVGIWLVRRKDAVTPLFMRRRLWTSGMRPISPVVDLTNYVMLEIGQPLHPFAAEKIAGGIRVRRALVGETLETLDGVQRKLEPDDIVIADGEGPVALAGVMGSARAEVDADTSRVFLEAALFAPSRIGRTMRRLGLRSEAAQRFAHGLAADLPLRAAARLRALAPAVGWEVLPGGIAVGEVFPPPAPIAVDAGYVRTLLGMQLTPEEQAAALRGFGFAVEVAGEKLAVQPPRDRIDVREACDVAEEVLRGVGIDRLGQELPPPAPPVAEPPLYRLRSDALRAFAALGYRVAVSYSLVDPSLLAMLSKPAEVEIANALSVDLGALRTTLITGLLQAIARNQARGVDEIALVEAGRVFHRSPAGVTERECLAFALCGDRVPLSRFPRHEADFFDLKGDLEAALAALRIGGAQVRPGQDPAFHPGRQAEIYVGERQLGVIGELHPQIAQRLGIAGRAFAGEISLEEALAARDDLTAKPLPRYPALVRDVALVVDEDLPYNAMRQEVQETLGDLLAAEALFDVFVGVPVPPGKKSLALRLTLQRPDRTLTESDAEQALSRLLQRLADRFGARLR